MSKSVEVRYAAQYNVQVITSAEYELVQRLYCDGRNVIAIAFIRDQYSLELVDAKALCDAIGTSKNNGKNKEIIS